MRIKILIEPDTMDDVGAMRKATIFSNGKLVAEFDVKYASAEQGMILAFAQSRGEPPQKLDVRVFVS